jgi:hypothetical protein
MTLHVISGRLATTTNVEALTTPTAITTVPPEGTVIMQSGDRHAETVHSLQELGRVRAGVGESDTSYVAGDAAASSSGPITGGWR